MAVWGSEAAVGIPEATVTTPEAAIGMNEARVWLPETAVGMPEAAIRASEVAVGASGTEVLDYVWQKRSRQQRRGHGELGVFSTSMA